MRAATCPSCCARAPSPVETIEAVLGQPVVRAAIDHERPNAPGQLASHYAPAAKVRLDARDVRDGEALLAFGADRSADHRARHSISAPRATSRKRRPTCLPPYARSMPAAADTIAVMPIPEEGLGEAINDRLRRAAAPR